MVTDPREILRVAVATTIDWSQHEPTVEALGSVDTLVEAIKDCVWKQQEDGSVEMVDVETIRAALAPFVDGRVGA